MDETLAYATVPKTRLSRLAVAAGIGGISIFPVFLGVVWFLNHVIIAVVPAWGPEPMPSPGSKSIYDTIYLVLVCIFNFLLPLGNIVVGFVALQRIKNPGRLGVWPPDNAGLRGRAWAIVGIAASAVLPLADCALLRGFPDITLSLVMVIDGGAFWRIWA